MVMENESQEEKNPPLKDKDFRTYLVRKSLLSSLPTRVLILWSFFIGKGWLSRKRRGVYDRGRRRGRKGRYSI
jgi:hypothetical protein